MKAFLTLPIRLLSHNIRYATTAPFKGEELWAVRSPRLINELRYNTLHNRESFICLQEVLQNQLIDILDTLNNGNSSKKEWASIGVGRDDGKTAGEYSPILYRPDVWDLKDFKTLWLSETPDRPSKGWDAGSIRIVTIGVFGHKESGKQIVAMNTHLDNQGSKSRLEGAKLIVKTMKSLQPTPIFLAGDFNSEPNEEAYGVFSSPDSPVSDLRDSIPSKLRYGEENTFTGFGNQTAIRIDYLFLAKGSDWTPQGYAVLANKFEDGVYNSDHRAVVGDVLLNF
ncbi:putative endonuclease exonuclease phosphatase protein [Venturia nashicola]|nr:putative endonuclease exonuclease phosphatase protein [Venturia nashicola]